MKRTAFLLCLVVLFALTTCESFCIKPVEPTAAPVHDASRGRMDMYVKRCGR